MACVDVLIVSYNTRELLRDCLASIRAHAPEPARVELRISVLDNASSDGSADMVAADFPEVRLVRSEENRGFGVANNLLARTSEADHVLLLNSDTLWRGDVVAPLLEVLEAAPENAIVGPRLIFPDGTVQLSSRGLPNLAYELALPLRGTRLRALGPRWDAAAIVAADRQDALRESREPRETDFLWATCWLMRRADAVANGPFDERFAMYDEDLDLCYRLRTSGRRIVYCPGVELVHLGGASSATSQAKLALMRGARYRFYQVHGRRLTAVAVRWVVPVLWRLGRHGSRAMSMG